MANTYEEYLAEEPDEYEQYVKESAPQDTLLQAPTRLSAPVKLPPWSSKAAASGVYSYDESDETRRKRELWDKSQDVAPEDMPINLRLKQQLARDRFVYGDDQVSARTKLIKDEDKKTSSFLDKVKKKRDRMNWAEKQFVDLMSHATNDQIEPPAQPEGSWNPLVHSGKVIQEHASGIRQLLGDDDNPFSKVVQQRKETYDQYDHPLAAQIGGEALNMAPYLAAGPLIGAASKPMLNSLLANRAITTPPIIGGALGGGAYGGSYHVDPESEAPWEDRGKAAGIGAIGGSIADVAVKAGRTGKLLTEAQKARKDLQGDLPSQVRAPAGELWNRQAQADKAHNIVHGGGQGNTYTIGAKTKGIYENAAKNFEEDIITNAAAVRKNITGANEPAKRGDRLKSVIGDLQTNREAARESADNSTDTFFNSGKVAIANTSDVDDVIDGIHTFIKQREIDPHNHQVKKIIDKMRVLEDQNKAGYTNVRNVLSLQQLAKSVLNDTKPTGNAGIVATKVRKDIDDMLKSKNLTGDVQDFKNAYNARRDYSDLYSANPIVADASKKISGDKGSTATELSNQLFSTSTGGGVGETARKLDAIRKIAQSNPQNKEALKNELTDRLLSGGGEKGNLIDIAKFDKAYLNANNRGDMSETLNTLFSPQELNQLNALHNVTRRHQFTRQADNTAGLSDLSPQRLAMTTPITVSGDMLATMPVVKQLGGQKLLDFVDSIQNYYGLRASPGDQMGTGMLGFTTMDQIIEGNKDRQEDWY